MVESPSKPENVHNLTRVEDQVRIDDDALTAKLPGRKSSRNRAIYKKADSYHNFPARAGSTIDKHREQPPEIRRINTVK